MHRVGRNDFYTFEVTQLSNGQLCIPHRFFTRNGAVRVKAWSLSPTRNSDGDSGWIVEKSIQVDCSVSELSVTIMGLVQGGYLSHGLPRVQDILGNNFILNDHGYAFANFKIGEREDPSAPLTPWNEPTMNPWRIKARGKQVISCAQWLYCDDTSGNRSKKWNEHNSFLMASAGLPRELAQSESTISFLCTSNAAPPLEMLDGVVTEIE